MTLGEIIIQKMKEDGPLSFRDFMEMAVYHSELGYYTSGKEKIGKRGDFFTGPAFSPVFGEMIARQIEEMWKHTGEDEFTIIEYGAGPGFLCKAILDYMKEKSHAYDKLNYCIIEKSPAMIKQAKALLPEKVKWLDSIRSVSPVTGCVLSNELVDNFSVHRVLMQNGSLKEIFVDYNNGFVEIVKPATQELIDYLNELKITLPEGFCTEINLEAAHWMKEIAAGLKKGYVLTIDYGYPAGELFFEHRKKGTLTCYNNHKVSDRPYTNIGEQDITAHVNFSALCLWGYKHGLQYSGFTDQCRFLLSLGFYDYLKKTEQPGQDYLNYKRERALAKTLLSDMGHTFKVLIQHKEMEGTKLMGLPKSRV